MSGEGVAAVGPLDLQIVAGLHGRCFPREPWDETTFAHSLAIPGTFACLAALEGEPRGFVLGRNIAGEGEILSLGVDPLARRRGLGRRLVAAALAAAQVGGARRVLLEVAVDNRAALRLYEDCGFSAVGRRPRYYGRGPAPAADALLLAIELPGGQVVSENVEKCSGRADY